MYTYCTRIYALGSKQNLESMVEDSRIAPLIKNVRIGGAMKSWEAKDFKAKTGNSLHGMTCDITIALRDSIHDVQQLLGNLLSDYMLENVELKFRFY